MCKIYNIEVMPEVSFNHQYEVFSPLSYEDFLKKNLFDLLVSIHNQQRANWENSLLWKNTIIVQSSVL